MRRLMILAAVAALAACAGQTPAQQMSSMRTELQSRMINLYGYQAYAECRGRGLPLGSNALVYCLDAHGPSPAAIARAQATSCHPEETLRQCDDRLGREMQQ